MECIMCMFLTIASWHIDWLKVLQQLFAKQIVPGLLLWFPKRFKESQRFVATAIVGVEAGQG